MDYLVKAYQTGVKLAYNLQDARRVMQLAKRRFAPRALRGNELYTIRGGNSFRSNKIFTPKRGDTLTPFLSNEYNRELISERVIPAIQKNPEQRQMFNSIGLGHELDELGVKISPSFIEQGHASPDVILREHNRLTTMPSEYKPTSDAFNSMRYHGKEERLINKVLPQYEHGRSPRLSRHARKHVTQSLDSLYRKRFG